MAQASAVRQLNVRVAASFGVAVLATVVAMQMGAVSPAGPNDIGAAMAQDAYNTVFVCVSAWAAMAALLAAFLPDPKTQPPDPGRPGPRARVGRRPGLWRPVADRG